MWIPPETFPMAVSVCTCEEGPAKGTEGEKGQAVISHDAGLLNGGAESLSAGLADFMRSIQRYLAITPEEHLKLHPGVTSFYDAQFFGRSAR
jgi:hypothetical protein